ncbi:hypothetical protein IFM89_018221 [Coptis chinensis]|uniref:F-box associated beta-propeller type 3 domain-containing protein n=1 Tax=Coptis chinensis TaxID=261450 RepID=A0A835LVI7_9MAGN|nr:hypothetical protein IFM89_018221 [Coptis chinensis]
MSANRYFDQNISHSISEILFVNSSNGIICLQVSDTDLALWNPATKQFRPLPQYLIPSGHRSGSDVEQYSFSPVLGFDVKNNDYKVVKFTTIYEEAGINMEIETYHVEASVDLFAYFDFNDEVIGTTPLPDACKLDQLSCDFFACSIDFLSDKLVFIYAAIEDSYTCINHFEIWVLDDYKVKESWTKQYTTGSVSSLDFFPKAFSKNGEFLFLIKGPEE